MSSMSQCDLFVSVPCSPATKRPGSGCSPTSPQSWCLEPVSVWCRYLSYRFHSLHLTSKQTHRLKTDLLLLKSDLGPGLLHADVLSDPLCREAIGLTVVYWAVLVWSHSLIEASELQPRLGLTPTRSETQQTTSTFHLWPQQHLKVQHWHFMTSGTFISLEPKHIQFTSSIT